MAEILSPKGNWTTLFCFWETKKGDLGHTNMVHYESSGKECQRDHENIKQNEHKILQMEGDE